MKKKTIKHKVKFSKGRKLKDGSYREVFHFPKAITEALYKDALSENKITLEELIYQSANRPNAPLKKLIIAAHFVRRLSEFAERTIKKTTGKKSKITNDIRADIR